MSGVPPALGLSATEVENALATASLAPSVHNSQPWRFRVLPRQIELHANLERRVRTSSPIPSWWCCAPSTKGPWPSSKPARPSSTCC